MKCVNCNSTEDLKKFYIVPLENGGNDIESNIVMLCSKCFKLASTRKRKNGRPRVALNSDIENVLHQYIQCKIGTKEAKELIGLTEKNNSTWQRLLKEYRAKYNIIDSRNSVDVFANSPRIGSETRRQGYVKIDNITYEFWNDEKVRKKEFNL